MKNFFKWLMDLCPETGELFMGTMALRYAWLIADPELSNKASTSVLQKTLQIAAPLGYWTTALAVVGALQILSLFRDILVGRASVSLRKKASSAAMIAWGLISYSYLASNQPFILSLTFMLFCGFCFFLLLLLHRKERFVQLLPEGKK